MKKSTLDRSLKIVDSWLSQRIKSTEVNTPGYCVAISHNGKIVFNKAYGVANIERNEGLTTEHIFRIASHSKTFTATAVMQLQEKNKLRIDDRLCDHLTWLQKHSDKRWQNVTIRQVLSHSAGIIRDGEDADYWQLEGSFPDKDKLEADILNSKLILENNVKLKYSNYGYSLLGLVIENASGQEYNQYVVENIVKPLELSNTGPDYTVTIKDKMATGYSIQYQGKRIPIEDTKTNSMSPATGFYSTSEDMCKYFDAHMVGSGKLLSDESKKEMQRSQFAAYDPSGYDKSSYGLGVILENINNTDFITHGGGYPGFITRSGLDSKNKLVITVLTNSIEGPSKLLFSGVHRIINYYQNNFKDNSKNTLELEGKYESLWGLTQILDMGDKLVTTYSDSWWILSSPETLSKVSDSVYKIDPTDSYASEGELVKFEVKENKVAYVKYSGATLWPEKVWQEKIKNKKVIEAS